MDLFSELIQAVKDDNTISSTSALYTDPLIKRYLNRAYKKAGGLFRWPETEDAKKTSTVSSQEYYDYPDTWRPDSIWKLKVDGVDYGRPLVFEDYLYEKEQTFPSGKTTAWANQWRRFFIYPTPTTSGNNNICVWGQKVVDALVNNSDTTIFSYSLPECNEAVVLEAVAMLKNKIENEKAGEFRSLEAKQILSIAWQKIKQDANLLVKTKPMFEVNDWFGKGGSTRIGDFE